MTKCKAKILKWYQSLKNENFSNSMYSFDINQLKKYQKKIINKLKVCIKKFEKHLLMHEEYLWITQINEIQYLVDSFRDHYKQMFAIDEKNLIS